NSRYKPRGKTDPYQPRLRARSARGSLSTTSPHHFRRSIPDTHYSKMKIYRVTLYEKKKEEATGMYIAWAEHSSVYILIPALDSYYLATIYKGLFAEVLNSLHKSLTFRP